nr:hypothetical protein [Streptomyces sp. 13-12-16]
MDVPLLQGEIIDAQHTGRDADMLVRKPAHQSEQGVRTRRDGQMRGQPGARTSSERRRDLFQRATQERRAPRESLGEPVHLLDERAATARSRRAKEPSHQQVDQDLPPGRREVGKAPSVATMDTDGHGAAARAGRLARHRPCREGYPTAICSDLVDHHGGQMGEDRGERREHAAITPTGFLPAGCDAVSPPHKKWIRAEQGSGPLSVEVRGS